jgi:DNA invertase Pin-like site-specific DNA recombinase
LSPLRAFANSVIDVDPGVECLSLRSDCEGVGEQQKSGVLPPDSLTVVHKVDRLARSRADDVEISLALKAAGTTLVSCTENIDETPSGMLLHRIMSSIAEFYSRNLANEVNKGLVQKAMSGGTPFRASVG